jgi:hypothetical protein
MPLNTCQKYALKMDTGFVPFAKVAQSLQQRTKDTGVDDVISASEQLLTAGTVD